MIASGTRVLVVDDEPAILRTVRANLGRRGFEVDVATTAEEAIARAATGPDLIVLDLGLPDRDGLDVIQAIRRRSDTPIIVLSVRDSEKAKVQALDLGADDYLTKPFGVEELVARVRVALRHSSRSASADEQFHTGDLTVDLDRRRVLVDGDEVRLTPTEYELLVVLVRNADRVVTDARLLQQVWGPEYGDEDHYLHVYVARLRKKLERDPQNPRYLRTEPGVGYRLLTEARDEH
jgi:two-component system, OmpR family, KDP operon response regulator KdpE